MTYDIRGAVKQKSAGIWSEWRLTVIAATVRIALVDILDPVSYTHLTLPTICSV